MSRFQIVVLSVVCCLFGGLALRGPQDYRDVAYALNAGLAVVLCFVAGDDLRRRGHRLGYLYAASYALPLIGLMVYGAMSNRPQRSTV